MVLLLTLQAQLRVWPWQMHHLTDQWPARSFTSWICPPSNTRGMTCTEDWGSWLTHRRITIIFSNLWNATPQTFPANLIHWITACFKLMAATHAAELNFCPPPLLLPPPHLDLPSGHGSERWASCWGTPGAGGRSWGRTLCWSSAGWWSPLSRGSATRVHELARLSGHHTKAC